MKKTMLTYLSLLVFGIPVLVSAYPTEIDSLLPPETQFNENKTETLKRSFLRPRPPLRGGEIDLSSPPIMYFFVSDLDFEEVKSHFFEEGIILKDIQGVEKEAATSYLKSKGHFKNARILVSSDLKRARGISSGWRITLSSHTFDPETKEWILQTTITFSKLKLPKPPSIKKK